MTDFKRIDSTAYDADKPLDSFLLVRTHENTKAIREKRGRSAVWCAGDMVSGAIVQPEISGFRDRSMLYFLYYLSTYTTEIKVTVRCRAETSVAGGGAATEATLSVFAISLDRFLTSPVLPDGQATNLTGGATTSSNITTTVDVSDIARGWIIVGVGVLSTEGTAVEIAKSNGTDGPQVYRGFYANYHILDQHADLGTTSELKHWGLSLRTGSKISERVPDRRALFLDYDVTRHPDKSYLIFFTEMIPSAGALGSDENRTGSFSQHEATDSLYYIPLGVVSVDSVSISDSDVRHPDRGSTLDAGQRASVRSLQPEVASLQRQWLSVPRIHHIGPTTTAPTIDRISGSTVLSTTFVEFASCLIGDDDPYTYNSTNYVKTAISVQALVVFTVPVNDWNRENVFDLDFKLVATDLDGSSNPKESESGGAEARVVAIGSSVFEQVAGVGAPFMMNYSDEGRLLSFTGVNIQPTQSRHSLRGSLPEASIYREVMLDLPMSLVDDQVSNRRLSLQVRPANLVTYGGVDKAGDITNTPYQYFPMVHVITLTVASRPYLDEPRDLSSIGV